MSYFSGNVEAQYQLDQLFQELSDRYAVLETLQRTALRVALREERARYCYFIHCLKPMMEEEVAILDERNNVREILDLLSSQALDPENLPEASEQAIKDLQGHQVRVWEVLRTKVASGHIDDHNGSDGGSLSRKSSSLCSIDDDASDSDGEMVTGMQGGQGAIQHGVIAGMGTLSRGKIQRKLSNVLTNTPGRMPAVVNTGIGGSYDSGFMSQHEQHYAAMFASSNTTTASTANSSGSPESEPSIVLKQHHIQQQQQHMIVNGSGTMRPHTISTGYHSRTPISQAVFDPPSMMAQHQQQKLLQRQQQEQRQEQVYGDPATLMRLSKPVPPPRVPIRLNALDQPTCSVNISGNASDSISLTSGSDYAPIYANANEIGVVPHPQLIAQQQQIYQHTTTQHQNQFLNGHPPGRRQRSASTSSNHHETYLELQPVGSRTKTPQPPRSRNNDEIIAIRQLDFAQQQLLQQQQQQVDTFYQTADGMIYASVPMQMENNGTIRRQSAVVNGSAQKPVPPMRRGSTEALSVMHPNGRPPQHQQLIYQQTQQVIQQQQMRAQNQRSAQAMAAVVDHALAVGAGQSPQPTSKTQKPNGQLSSANNFQAQLQQAISQRANQNSAPTPPSSHSQQQQIEICNTSVPPPAPPPQDKVKVEDRTESSDSEISSGNNQLLAALKNKKGQLRKTTPNDRSAPKVGAR